MATTKKILITGASGFLGYHLLRAAHAKGFEVYGLYNSGVISFERSTNLQVDLRNYIDMGNVIDEIEPDAVIHSAAYADPSLCQKNPELSYEINVEVTRNLAGICSDYQVPFVFTSTDLVYDGMKGNYTEEDAPSPVMIYGEHKVKAEEETMRVYPEALIVRCPLMFGALEASDRTYFSTFIKGFKEGKSANLFYDEYRSVCGARSISQGILHLCEEASGLFHLAGAEQVSRYDFGVAAIEAYGLDKSLARSISQKDVQLSAPRPADVSLNILKAQSFGYRPLGYQQELRDIASGSYI